MELKGITINGERHRVEAVEGGLAAGDFAPVAPTLPELVNRLRLEGHEVFADPTDDGLTEVWFLCATSPKNRTSEDVWFFASKADALARKADLSARHPHLDQWRTESHRLTTEELRILAKNGIRLVHRLAA